MSLIFLTISVSAIVMIIYKLCIDDDDDDCNDEEYCIS